VSAAIRLGERAHCRFGDKGDTGLFVLIPYDPHDYGALVAAVTPERVGAHLGAAQIICRACPELGALVVVVPGSLGGGVTASLALDAHGKTRSGILLDMAVPWADPAP
jgi:pimeloyl-ACP methyl ester carboxylesterase